MCTYVLYDDCASGVATEFIVLFPTRKHQFATGGAGLGWLCGAGLWLELCFTPPVVSGQFLSPSYTVAQQRSGGSGYDRAFIRVVRTARVHVHPILHACMYVCVLILLYGCRGHTLVKLRLRLDDLCVYISRDS